MDAIGCSARISAQKIAAMFVMLAELQLRPGHTIAAFAALIHTLVSRTDVVPQLGSRVRFAAYGAFLFIYLSHSSPFSFTVPPHSDVSNRGDIRGNNCGSIRR
jgi:hypothetical protein